MLILTPVVGFTIAHNEFEPVPDKSKKIQLQYVCLDKNGEVVEKFGVGQKEHPKYATYEPQIRDPKKPANMDEAVVFDLHKIRS